MLPLVDEQRVVLVVVHNFCYGREFESADGVVALWCGVNVEMLATARQ